MVFEFLARIKIVLRFLHRNQNSKEYFEIKQKISKNMVIFFFEFEMKFSIKEEVHFTLFFVLINLWH